MSTDQLKAALKRRGFHIIIWTHAQTHLRTVVRLGDFSMPWEISISVLDTIKMGIGNLIAHEFSSLTRNHDFMCCIQCQEPLLQKEIRMIGIPERVFDPDYKPEPPRYRYRSAKAGPDSDVLNVCPGCGIELNHQTVIEIKDETV